VPVSNNRPCQQVVESATCPKRTILPRPATVNQPVDSTPPYLTALRLQTPSDERHAVVPNRISLGPAAAVANTALNHVSCNNALLTRTGSAGTVTTEKNVNCTLITRAGSSGNVPVPAGRTVVARAASSGTMPLTGPASGPVLARAASSGTVPLSAQQSSQRRNSFLEQLLTQGKLVTNLK
jgi:hypothetical protein